MFVTEYALCFSEIGRIDIEVLMTHWKEKEYHLSKTLPIERDCFRKASVGTQQWPDTEMAVEVELEGSSTCSKVTLALARDRGCGLFRNRGPKVDYSFQKSTSNNSNLMFHINDFYGSSWDSREPEVTYASGLSGFNEFLENTEKRKALGQIDSIFD